MSGLAPEDLTRWLRLWGLGAARTWPLAWFVPAFGGATLPVQLRLALGLGLSLLCFPSLVAQPDVAHGWLWILLLARESIVGLAMSFVCACMFRAAEAAGHTVDVLRGQNLAEVLSPMGEGRTSPMGVLFMLLSVVIFFQIGGLGLIAHALSRSYDAVPVATPLAERSQAVLSLVVLASGRLIEAAVGLCAPVLVALLLTDVVLGVVGRSVPSLSLFSLGLPLRSLLATSVVLLGIASLDVALQTGFARFMQLFAWIARLGR